MRARISVFCWLPPSLPACLPNRGGGGGIPELQMPAFLKRPTVLHFLTYTWALIFAAGHWLVTRAYQPLAEYWVETWVGVWEESTKSLVRECFQASVRLVNGLCGWLVARLDTKRDEARASPAWDLAAWEKWRPSTFNWLVECHRAEQGRLRVACWRCG